MFWKPIAVIHGEAFKSLCERNAVSTNDYHAITSEEFFRLLVSVRQGNSVPYALRDLIETALEKVVAGDNVFLRPGLNAGQAALMVFAYSWARYHTEISEFQMETAAKRMKEIYGYQ